MPAQDVENLQPAVRHRDKSVYACLACLTFAFIVISLGGGAMLLFVWRELQSQVASTKPTGSEHVPSASDRSTFKSGHLAYVRATNGEVRNQTMIWEAIDLGSGSSVGNNFEYTQAQRVLKVKGEGSYFIYMDLSFQKTTTECNSSSIVEVTLKSENGEVLLPCVVELECHVMAPVSKMCPKVALHLKRDTRLSGHMTVRTPNSTDGGFGWKLVSNDSGFGMFLVGSL